MILASPQSAPSLSSPTSYQLAPNLRGFDDGTQIRIATLGERGEEQIITQFPSSEIARDIIARIADLSLDDSSEITLERIITALKQKGISTTGQVIAKPFSDAMLPGHERLATVEDLPTNPVDARDPLTSCLGKAALYSQRALDEVSEAIPGEKVLVLLDFNHMSGTNDHGLRAENDQLIKEFPELISRSLGDIPHKLFRYGGDEFALVLQSRGPATVEALNKMLAGYNARRDQILAPDNPAVQCANRFAVIREASRKLFAEYFPPAKRHDPTFTEKSFCEIIRPLVKDAPLDATSGQLLLALAQQTTSCSGSQGRAMSITAAAVAMPPEITVTELINGLATAEFSIHHKKEAGSRDIGNILTSDKSLVERSATKKAIETVAQAEQNYKEALSSSELYLNSIEKLRAMCADVAIGYGVIRLNLAQEFLLSQIFPISAEREVHVTDFDIARFGVINNQLGYDRGDELVRGLAAAVNKVSPNAACLRVVGGRMSVITDKPLDAEQIAGIVESVTNAIAAAGIVERAKVEASLRDAMEKLIPGREDSKAPAEFGTVAVRSAKFLLNPHHYLKQAMRHAEFALLSQK